VQDDRSAGVINALDHSSVSVGCTSQGGRTVDLTGDEYIILIKFRRIGSPRLMVEKCLQKINAIEALIGGKYTQ
jgi:hypothetical protein